jgi:hypothetical protein
MDEKGIIIAEYAECALRVTVLHVPTFERTLPRNESPSKFL